MFSKSFTAAAAVLTAASLATAQTSTKCNPLDTSMSLEASIFSRLQSSPPPPLWEVSAVQSYCLKRSCLTSQPP